MQRMRGVLIRAALTVVLGYLAAGAPKLRTAPLGGFEDWDRLVRRPLIWLGLADPLEASTVLREQDPDMETTRAMLTAWWDVFAGDAVTAAELVQRGAALGEGMDTNSPTYPELREALLMVSGGRQITTRQLGYWLRAHKDRIYDGKRLVMLKADRNGIARWQVATGEAGMAEDLPM
jgi:putative DNA primase/helicase